MIPSNQCDIYGACGPYGVCKKSRPLICKCLKGFVPQSNEEWSKGNWTRGCKRQADLRCHNSTNAFRAEKGKGDGFWKLSGWNWLHVLDWRPYRYAGVILFWRRTFLRLAYSELEETPWCFDMASTIDTSTNPTATYKGEQFKRFNLLELPIFDFESILVATDNFNTANKLGLGGKLKDGKVVAVKRLSSRGYMSPEDTLGGIFSEKSDVVSFGVLILEIVYGKKNNSFCNDEQYLSLPAYAWKLWSESNALNLMDEALAD
ncbi:hypothetical protein GH714_001289 [Hevea brasiliensis]|uniref:Protein kinase domain-containing protein n=1 Tax=Hevea brasiliensis TaxID=3981 RepID=A0A6A6LU95_HEVBR|nr:hypothetical protein GH714_001289 [Hevea brasiliensis]